MSRMDGKKTHTHTHTLSDVYFYQLILELKFHCQAIHPTVYWYFTTGRRVLYLYCCLKKNLNAPRPAVKVAVNTIVPRSPFFAFCTPNGLGGANPAVNTPRPSRGTRIESCDFIVLIGDP